jgi:hypothetical protein
MLRVVATASTLKRVEFSQPERSVLLAALYELWVVCPDDDIATKRISELVRRLGGDPTNVFFERTHQGWVVKNLDRAAQLQAMPHADYLRTREWEDKRREALRRARKRCQLCNSPESLEVHHRTYKRLGDEWASDLTVLCSTCHTAFSASGRELVDDWLGEDVEY